MNRERATGALAAAIRSLPSPKAVGPAGITAHPAEGRPRPRIFESKGYNLKSGSWTVNRGTSDLIKGNGTARGYTSTHYPDGAVTYSSWEGKTTTTVVDGKSIATSAGTWKLVSGTGEWRNREAGGTWKAKGVGDGVSLVEWEGEWRPER